MAKEVACLDQLPTEICQTITSYLIPGEVIQMISSGVLYEAGWQTGVLVMTNQRVIWAGPLRRLGCIWSFMVYVWSLTLGSKITMGLRPWITVFNRNNLGPSSVQEHITGSKIFISPIGAERLELWIDNKALANKMLRFL